MDACGIFIVQRTAVGHAVIDAAGRVHDVRSEAELGALIANLLDDPAIPKHQMPHPIAVELEKATASWVRKRLPTPFDGLAEPLVAYGKKNFGAKLAAIYRRVMFGPEPKKAAPKPKPKSDPKPPNQPRAIAVRSGR